ncbi:MAG: LON peptidase substrate-binding domain-containing protein [Pirellulales bacterium]
MPIQDESHFVPADFRGVVRLFPVPNLVLFPHVMQPLHVFEPRYREMTEDALAGDRLIATAQFEPGWEADYDGRPALKPFGCLGKIVTHHRMPDGRFNLLLVGLSRIQLVEELPPTRAYREAKALLVEDCHPAGGHEAIAVLHEELIEAFRTALSGLSEAREHLAPLLDGDVGLGPLTDIVAYTLSLPTEIKETLLEEIHVDRRARRLIKCIAELDESDQDRTRGRFPPDFSAN